MLYRDNAHPSPGSCEVSLTVNDGVYCFIHAELLLSLFESKARFLPPNNTGKESLTLDLGTSLEQVAALV